LDVITHVYDYVCAHIKYDKHKAETVKSGYLPDPDETLATGKGICFDYASLTAAMLRSQGIPVKVIFGHVSPDNLYHAWNMFYTEEEGWVTVEFKVDRKTWSRIDLTFSANGANQKFIGDGGNYADVYEY
jgi:transglutaminase-like putative cysteine protease